jgi:hypothetical protein
MVLGMHRSGTSAVTRVLNLLGVPLGAELLQPQADNSKGFWEHAKAVDIHERLLASLGRTWHDIREMPAGWLDHPATDRAIEEIADLAREELESQTVWAVKDPRICRLVPLWISAMERLGVSAKALFVVRDPREVALSLRARDGWSLGHSYLMWTQHFLEAFEATGNIPRAIVAYDQLLDDWRGVVNRAGQELGMLWPRSLEDAAADIEAFISPGDRHQRVGGRKANPELSESPLPALLATLFEQSRAVAAGDGDWSTFGETDDAYRVATSVFSLPIRNLVSERNELERVALERLDNINGLVIAKDLVEGRERGLQYKLDVNSALLEEHKSTIAHQLERQAELMAELHIKAGLERTIQLAERLHSELWTKLEDSGVNHSRLQEELAALIAANQMLADARVEAELKFANAQQHGVELEFRIGDQASELSRLRETNTQLMIDKARLEDGLSSRSSVLADLTGKYNDLTARHDDLAGRHGDLTGKYEDLSGKYEGLTGKYDSLCKYLQSASDEKGQALVELDEVRAERAALEEAVKAAETRLADANVKAGDVRWLLKSAWRNILRRQTGRAEVF